jgi:hypothetical protein
LTALAIGAVSTATGVAVAPFVAPVLLGVVGFSAAGPVAGMYPPVRPTIEVASKPFELLGSIAAGMQAGIGNVVAGSLFAAAQSVAMGGAVPAVVSAAGGMSMGAAGAAIAAVVI